MDEEVGVLATSDFTSISSLLILRSVLSRYDQNNLQILLYEGMMNMTFAKVKNSFWRVPLIALIGGLIYTPCYTQIVLRFGVIEPGVIDDKVGLLADGILLMAIMVLGWAVLLRKQTRTEVFISSSIVVVYGLILALIQFFSGSVSGTGFVTFLYLFKPLEWMVFPVTLSRYLQQHMSISIPFIRYLYYFIPWLFVLFAEKNISHENGQ